MSIWRFFRTRLTLGLEVVGGITNKINNKSEITRVRHDNKMEYLNGQ